MHSNLASFNLSLIKDMYPKYVYNLDQAIASQVLQVQEAMNSFSIFAEAKIGMEKKDLADYISTLKKRILEDGIMPGVYGSPVVYRYQIGIKAPFVQKHTIIVGDSQFEMEPEILVDPELE